MKMSRLWVGVGLVFVFASLAQAQATRTWVSGVGDDVNPCSRTAPCKTFAGAISKTAAGGEINILDPGGYGAVTITKSITINGGGSFGFILASGGGNGIIVNAAATDVVNIRNLSIDGAGTGVDGIRFRAGKTLSVANVDIFGFTSDGIEVAKAAAGALNVDNTLITDCAGTGIKVVSSSGAVGTAIGGTRIVNSGFAVRAGNNAVVSVRNSDLSTNTIGLLIDAGNAQANTDNVRFASNSIGISASAGVARMMHDTFFSNSIGINPAGGSICSAGDNQFAGNGTNGNPSVNIGACTITTQ